MLFELHCHSRHSDGNSTPKEIVEYAMSIGLSGIAITDHDAIAGSLESLGYSTEKFRIISGMEISAKEGHILGLDIKEFISRDFSAKDTVDAIHGQGGLAIAAHPYDRWRHGVGDLIFKLEFDAVEVVNGHSLGTTNNARKVCMEAGLPMVGGSDAHTLDEIGSVLVEYEGDVLEAIKSGKTSIRSKPTAKLILNHGLGIIERRVFKFIP